jgi:large subunit ribosomal protein L21
MFAVFKTGGKQYRVAAEDVLKVDKVKGEPGEIVEFGEVLVVGGDSVTLGAPTVAGATVAAEVLDQARGPKIIAFKKRRRKNSRRKRGHRQEFTLLRITEILTDGKKANQDRAAAAETGARARAGGLRCRICRAGSRHRKAAQGCGQEGAKAEIQGAGGQNQKPAGQGQEKQEKEVSGSGDAFVTNPV